MVKISVAFRINEYLWYKAPSRVFFYEDHFELKWFWRKRAVIPYEYIVQIKKAKYHFIGNGLLIHSRDASIDLISGNHSNAIISEFRKLGFTIDE